MILQGSFKLLLFSLPGLVFFACSQPERANQPEHMAAADSGLKKPDSLLQTSALKYIVFFGNSLTAGYGVETNEAFPALIQQKIDSLKLPYKVVNAGLSGETSSGGRSRIDWILQQPVSIFVLELGGNDGLRGIPLEETYKNLQSIIDKVRQKYPSAKLVLAGMQIPPNMGAKYTGDFKKIFRQLAEKNKMTLIPFLLEGVGGIPELNQADGIHPNAAGHQMVAANVWKVLDKIR
jgi:acyl-CoA thioesterase I